MRNVRFQNVLPPSCMLTALRRGVKHFEILLSKMNVLEILHLLPIIKYEMQKNLYNKTTLR